MRKLKKRFGMIFSFLLILMLGISINANSYGTKKFYGYTMTGNVSIGAVGQAYATTSISPTNQIVVSARVYNAVFANGVPVSGPVNTSMSSAKSIVYGQGRCIKAFGTHSTSSYGGHSFGTSSFYY